MDTMTDRARHLAARLRGSVVPAVLTPFRGDGALDETALDRYAATLAQTGVGGLAVWAHTGRGPYLHPPQRRRVMQAFRAATTSPIIAGVAVRAPDGLDEAIRMAEEGLAQGADAIMVFPPLILRDQPDREAKTLEWHRRLAGATDAPMILFLLHDTAGGFPYSTGLLRELFSLPQVAGIKLATLDRAVTCQDVTALVHREFPGRLVITGEDRMFGPSLMWGADAALVGIAAAAPELSVGLVETWKRRDREASGFLKASERLDRFAMATFTDPIEGYVQRMLWVAEWQGLIPAEAAFDPWGPHLDPAEQALIFSVCDNLGLARWPTSAGPKAAAG